MGVEFLTFLALVVLGVDRLGALFGAGFVVVVVGLVRVVGVVGIVGVVDVVVAALVTIL